MPRPFRRAVLIAVAFSAATLSLSLHAQTMGTPERYTANAINMDRGAAGTIELVVNRWSTDKDRDRLMSVLMSKGPEKLLDVLQGMPRAGYIKTPDRIGWDLDFTWLPRAGRRRARVLRADRRIGFWEAANRPRTIDTVHRHRGA
jgi:hypothetical protein